MIYPQTFKQLWITRKTPEINCLDKYKKVKNLTLEIIRGDILLQEEFIEQGSLLEQRNLFVLDFVL